MSSNNEAFNKIFTVSEEFKKVENYLKERGVSVRDEYGNFRDTYDVLKDIAEKIDFKTV